MCFHVGPLPYNNLIYEGIAAAKERGVPVLATPCAHFGEAETPRSPALCAAAPDRIAATLRSGSLHDAVEARQLAARGVAEP